MKKKRDQREARLEQFASACERYMGAMWSHALRQAPSETEVRSPVQGNYSAETIFSIAIERLQKWVVRHGMPNHFWTFFRRRFKWVHDEQYRAFCRRQEAFEKEFGSYPVDPDTLKDLGRNKEQSP